MTPPATIAHYRITGKLGEGGMGAVYRATDTKLNRDVAIKVLPDAFAADPDRMARFAREAQVLASLNHPNIAAIYGVEERALVMELVEGPTLAERIAQGPIPWDEALPLIRQLIEALEYAHEKGVIHRDLKPANLKVTPDGRLKVLDFGLAKAMAGETPGGDPAASPTLTMRATMAGTIMGTAGYMAPEQARGHNVDKRADIWAFGTVLYEMLTGKELFVGPTISDTLAAVLRHDPDLTGLPAGARRLVEQCLVRDPRARLRDIGDARLLLNAPAAVPLPAPAGNPYRWVALALTVVAAVALWAPWRSAAPANRPLTRFRVDLGPDAVAGPRSTAAISPDGRRLAFSVRAAGGKTLLATQGLDQAKPTPLADTDGASDPFFSPDGKWIGFQAKGKLQKIPVEGGNPQELADAINARGATWGEDGTIIFTPATNTGLYRVSENGGGAQKLTEPSATNEQVHRWPQILPGGQTVLFTGHSQPTAFDAAQLEVLSLATHQWKAVSTGGYFGRYLPGGYLVYVRRGTLFGVRFDADKLAVRGAPVSLIDDLAASSFSAAGQFDFSRDGTLVYLSGKGLNAWPVTIVDRTGSVQTQIAAPFNYSGVRLSPDGKRIALVGVPGADADLWIQDLELGSTARLTFSGKVNTGCWAPDGKHILYSTSKTLWWVRSDGAGQPEKLLDTAEPVAPYSFSPDGRRLALTALASRLGTLTLTLDVSDPEHPKAGKLSDVTVGPQASFSPDGRWLAHISNDSGSTEVFVRPFPGPGGKWQISFGGGFYPTWSADGRQLYYLNASAHLMAVDYTVKGDSFTIGQSREFTPHPTILTGITPPYAVFPDGKRVAMYLPETQNDTGSVHVTVLLNFFDELRRRIP